MREGGHVNVGGWVRNVQAWYNRWTPIYGRPAGNQQYVRPTAAWNVQLGVGLTKVHVMEYIHVI